MPKAISGSKLCIKCLQKRGLDCFYKSSRFKDGFYQRCSDCCRKEEKEYYHKNRDKILRRSQGYRKRNASGFRKSGLRYRNKLRSELISAYGGKCSCCGESQFLFLTLEHLNHDGQEHRKIFGNLGVYRDLKRSGYPKDKYTVLCWNCNMATRYGAVCPHKRQK
jgi:hypothetical protein